jgi:hypothetical protein
MRLLFLGEIEAVENMNFYGFEWTEWEKRRMILWSLCRVFGMKRVFEENFELSLMNCEFRIIGWREG